MRKYEIVDVLFFGNWRFSIDKQAADALYMHWNLVHFEEVCVLCSVVSKNKLCFEYMHSASYFVCILCASDSNDRCSLASTRSNHRNKYVEHFPRWRRLQGVATKAAYVPNDDARVKTSPQRCRRLWW